MNPKLKFFIPLQVTIPTHRLRLREFTLGDATSVFRYSSLTTTTHYIEQEAHVTPYETEELIQRFIGWQFATPRLHLIQAITLADTGQLVGDIGLMTTNVESAVAELGFMMSPDYWQHGYGKEAAAAMLAYGFQTVGWERIVASCHKDNVASERILRGIGLKPTTETSADPSDPNYLFRPQMRYFGLDRQEWYPTE